jgi:Tol biopolymer transport system component
LRWQTVKTENFIIHYHDGGEELALATASIAERIHQRLTRLVEWVPKDRTEIVISDELDISNGFATAIPFNRIVIFPTPPDGLFGLEDHDGWLELVLTHEYLHILHLDKATGAPAVLRRIFGRFPLFLPNMWQPLWLIEGLAVHVETDNLRGIGRGQSSYYDMMMRMEHDRGIHPVHRVNQPMVRWPGYATPYLYGVHFYQYLVDRSGEDVPFDYVNHYSNNIVPFMFNMSMSRTSGMRVRAHWRQFEAYLDRKYRPQIEAVRSRGELAGERLTHHGYYANWPRVLQGGEIVYVAYDMRSRPALVRLDPESGKRRRLMDLTTAGARIDTHPDSGILVAQSELCHNAVLNFDLYRCDADGRHKRRLTKCGRYRLGAWSPDGDRIIAVRGELGINELHLLTAEGELIEVLWRGQNEEAISGLDWSADGNILVASVWRPGGSWNLELFSMSERSWTAITSDVDIQGTPQFMPDGETILYTSDAGGIYNLRLLELSTGRRADLTNVVGGAFDPVPGRDGEILYAGYGHSGFDIFRIEPGKEHANLPPVDHDPSHGSATLDAALPAGKLRQIEPDPTAEPDEIGLSSATAYRPWRGMRPGYWLPAMSFTNDRYDIGAVTMGMDALNRHGYFLEFFITRHDEVDTQITGSLEYYYDRFAPLLIARVERTLEDRLDNDDDLSRTRLEQGAVLEAVFPRNRIYNRWSIHAGLVHDKEKEVWRAAGVAPADSDKDNMVGLGLSLDSADYHPRSVSRSGGRNIAVVAEDSSSLGGDYSGQIYRLDWREFIRTGGETVLGVRASGGWGTDRPRDFELGGETNNTGAGALLLGTPGSIFNVRDFNLRGYPDGSLTGPGFWLGSLEFRFPIARLERGFWTWPIGLHQLHASVFVDAGSVWDEPTDRFRDASWGAGVEFNTEIVLAYYLRMPISLGYAHGFDTGGDDRLYLRLGVSF